VVNDGSKLDFSMLQTMHCVICHIVCQTYNALVVSPEGGKAQFFTSNNMGLLL